MTLLEAIATGKKFKRKAAADWYNLQTDNNKFSMDDLKATDYFTEDCSIGGVITLDDLETAFQAVNVSPPGISRPAFREFVLQLCGIVIR